MSAILELALAKINLTLQVLGRRADGYHELASLVAFASVGDRLELRPQNVVTLEVMGPTASAIDGPNLVEVAVERARTVAPDLRAGALKLEKHLPVAAGIGGGSANAAAALRALRRANPQLAADVPWHEIAAGIGADVPVCLESRASLMGGVGEQVRPLETFPRLAVLLANPRVPLATADVFRALAAMPLQGTPQPQPLPRFDALADVVAFMAARPNDLEPVARSICPVVSEVIAALAAEPGALITRMSGSGPTCFALHENATTAARAAITLTDRHPGWWVAAADLS